MQGSNGDCLPMKGHTRRGDAPIVLPIERTHRGGDAPTKQTNERTHKFFWTHETNKRLKMILTVTIFGILYTSIGMDINI